MSDRRSNDPDQLCEGCAEQVADRRTLLRCALAAGLVTPLLASEVAAADDPSKARPQVDDVFVHLKGDKKDQVVAVDDLPLEGPQILAYPKDPASGTIRKGSRMNQVVLARFKPEELDAETKGRSAEGVVAYSAICTHQGCPVSFWKKEKQVFYCSCHGSQFDPRKDGKRVFGPATRRLAALPVKIENGTLMVAGEFIGSLGPVKTKA